MELFFKINFGHVFLKISIKNYKEYMTYKHFRIDNNVCYCRIQTIYSRSEWNNKRKHQIRQQEIGIRDNEITEREKIDEELAYIQIKKFFLKMKIQSEFNVLFDEQ